MNNYFVETSINKIKESSENNKLVVFVGAGVSANSNIPTWKELIKEMAKDLGEFDLDNSQDLYLKIPQYYFNERGEKEYFEKLNKIFLNNHYRTNPLHKEIFKLEPTHIITTNYDTLLEDAAIESGYFYHTVRHDLDLPYDNLNKTIIKMHGDFANKNIVLKEDDYLNYSSNFTLIESYIKSIIATNTVLFIGYSVNDPNFNLIFQWVKNILKSHFQPAYLIENSKNYSRMEHAYYKNRGINILYHDEMNSLPKNKAFEDLNWRGNKLFDIVKYFNDFSKSNIMNDSEYVYNQISCFEKLNFIMPEQIVKSLKMKSVGYDLFGDRTLTILDENNLLVNTFSKIGENENSERLQSILMIFEKANIRGVSKDKQIIFDKESEHGNKYLSNIAKKIIENDSLLASRSNNNSNSIILEENYWLMLEQAYVYFEDENFIEAYKYYKNISLKSFYDKEYLIYYLSEFNRKHVGYFLINSPFIQIGNVMEHEINELDLDEIYLRLPKKERKSLEFIKEIQNFNLIYKVQNKLRTEVNVLKNAKRTVEKGGFSSNSSLNKQFHIINNIWLFIKANYLCIDKYSEVQSLYLSFIEGVFASNSTKSEKKSLSLFSDLKVDKIEELDLFSVYIIITKLKRKDLENILNDYNLKEIRLQKEAEIYLINVLDKVTLNIVNNDNKEKSKNYLYNLLTLASRLKWDIARVNEIAEKLLIIFNEKMFITDFKYINKFIVSMSNQDLISEGITHKYLETYLRVYQQNREIFEFDNAGFYRNLSIIYKNHNEFHVDVGIISGYLELIKKCFSNKKYDHLYELLNEIILPIVKGINDNQKEILLDLIQIKIDEIENKEESLVFNEITFYYRAYNAKTIKPNKIINKKILEDTVLKIKSKRAEFQLFSNTIESTLNILTDLYREGGIQKQEVESYAAHFKGFSHYFDLIFNDLETDLTDIHLLFYLKESEIKNLMKNNETAEKIYELYEETIHRELTAKDKEIFNKIYSKRFN